MNQRPSESETEERLPRIHCFGSVTSSLDVAFELVRDGRLDIWDSVLVRNQTEGRGQMRRHWVSSPGNLFASLRLSLAAPFNSTAAPIVVGALCANALLPLNEGIMVKWPNDLILKKGKSMGKIGGILLEERDGALIAGIGINLVSAPDKKELGPDAQMPADSLASVCDPDGLPSVGALWRSLVKHIYSVYKSGPLSPEIWQSFLENRLLWRGLEVEIRDGAEQTRGIFLGLDDAGGAMLETATGLDVKLGGFMSPIGATGE